MDIERVQRNANLDNSGVFNPQLIIPTTFRDCLTYEQQIVFLFRMKQNKLIEGDNITLTDNGDGTVTISADGGSSSGATYELVSVTPDEGYSSAYILENTDTGEQSGVKIQIPEVEDGVGISSITFDSAVAGGNQYDVNLTDGTSYQIVAPKGEPGTDGTNGTNGTNGTDGADGVGISSITFDREVASGNQYYVNLTNGSDYPIIAPKGTNGTDGEDGSEGVGIESITFDQAVADGNQYIVTLTDGSYYYIVAPKGSSSLPAITPTTDQGKVLTVNSSDEAEWETPSGGLPAITPSTDRGKVLIVNNSDQTEWASKEFVPNHSSSQAFRYLRALNANSVGWSNDGIIPNFAISFTTSSVLSQTTDYQDIILTPGTISFPSGLTSGQLMVTRVGITDGNNDVYYGLMLGRYEEFGKMMRLIGQLCLPIYVGSIDQNHPYGVNTNKIFTDAVIFVPNIIDSTHTPLLKGKYIDCTNPPASALPNITPTTDQGKVLTVNSSDQPEWVTPSGGGISTTDLEINMTNEFTMTGLPWMWTTDMREFQTISGQTFSQGDKFTIADIGGTLKLTHTENQGGANTIKIESKSDSAIHPSSAITWNDFIGGIAVTPIQINTTNVFDDVTGLTGNVDFGTMRLINKNTYKTIFSVKLELVVNPAPSNSYIQGVSATFHGDAPSGTVIETTDDLRNYVFVIEY